ncbi:MAG: MBL fold metallo-hydrolase, partial [Burkholderiales bacterium]|nr:MBL fold metallo-hydrolase [Burkholderiales bacterium]
QGVLLSSDTLHVTLDRQWVSFMYSFPNLIPLPPTSVEHIVTALAPFTFETIVGGWWNRNILTNGKEVVSRSAERYLA